MFQDKKLVSKILDSIAILNSLDKKRIIIHEGQKLHPSEIQLLMFLYHVQDTNITAIANKMDLTKGAISQTLSRLQKKGIISKEMFPEKKNELQVQFTEQGSLLMGLLNKGKVSLERKYLRYIKTLSAKEKQIIAEFLEKMLSIQSSSK